MEVVKRARVELQPVPDDIAPRGARPGPCASCGARAHCRLATLAPHAVAVLDAALGIPMRLRKRENLYRFGDPFTALFALRSGSLKTVMMAEDGREQVAGFHIPGDVLGLDAIGTDRHACEASALEDSEICVLSFARLEEIARGDPHRRLDFVRLMSQELRQRQEMMLLLGSRRAEERLAAFLLDLSSRYRLHGLSGSDFALRMTREEIASYLGLKLETVSRLFSRMQEEGLLQVQGRAVKLIDPVALRGRVGRSL